jgi:hypothetical protein
MTKEQTSERKVDTGPLPELPELPTAPAAPPNRPKTPLWRWTALAAVALIALGAALFLLRPADPLADPRPVAVVEGFAEAIEARDATRMLSYVEPTVLKKQIGPEVRAYLEYIQEIRFENARYELLENDGRTARVRWTGTMYWRIDYGEVREGTSDIDATYDLRFVEGAWYLSGAKLPQ